ncbi:hypothetical protein SOASR030_37400 [Leminorella grimontii]|uniref:Zinc finger DksA/TraR C4-type domain-containing protein n=1 Tax=Leminorella grimontii TaxID=82981 RepID=A0AAV5N677_9GAMM|nr:TraR/DksA C4-type zinc finger protein [Leminorella richardii]GKX57628.1 hypothetical protein SOASR030_37400 [Leminorella grimontii]
MSDVIDRGSAREIFIRELAIARHQNRPKPATSDGVCVDCDQPIEVARLKANPCAERCIDCQLLYERRRRHYRV